MAKALQAPDGAAIPQAGRVLVKAAHAASREAAIHMLACLGVAADAAQSSVEAREALSRRRYDLVLLDCDLAQAECAEAARELRNTGMPRSEAPMVAIATPDREYNPAAYLENGIVDILRKPIRREELARILHRWLPAHEVPQSQRNEDSGIEWGSEAARGEPPLRR